MTLLDDICEVHDGVLKAPPLRSYGHANTVCNSRELAKSKSASVDEHDHTEVYKNANILAIESVRIMQLASKNIEKERPEAEDRKSSTARTLYDIVNHDERESCKTCADSKICKRHESITWCINWNEREQKDEPEYVFEVGLVLGTVRQT